ncbi:MAG: hypothetical protein ABI185_00505 [Ginsengibacter sp.]
MKKNYLFSISFILINCFCYNNGFSQVNQDDTLLANSDKWKVQPTKGLFGLSKPVFGDYTTLDIIKLDSGRMKQKTKDSSSLSFEASGSEGSDWDQSKFLTIKKNRIYKLRLASKVDTTKAIFSIASESKQKKQTFLGKVLSKNDEGKNEELSYNRDIPGIIITDDNEVQWQFFINNFSGAYISSGYLKNGKDSLSMHISSFNADIVLVNANGEHLAALKFNQKPLYVWIRHDLKNSYRQAIAALFAVIIGIKDF